MNNNNNPAKKVNACESCALHNITMISYIVKNIVKQIAVKRLGVIVIIYVSFEIINEKKERR